MNRNAVLYFVDSNARGQVIEVARLLISAGADTNTKESQGRTAADIAAARGTHRLLARNQQHVPHAQVAPHELDLQARQPSFQENLQVRVDHGQTRCQGRAKTGEARVR